MSLRHGVMVLALAAALVTAGALVTRDSASAGELTGTVPANGGVALLNWSGGSTSEIVDDAGANGCRLSSIWSFPNGFPIGYLVGAPDFVNSAHLALYPGGNVPETPILAVCQRTELAPIVYRDRQFEVDETRDIVYAKGLSHADWGSAKRSAIDLTLDVYEPQAVSSAPRPAIVIIHGGGFRSGDSQRQQFIDAGRYYASRGWVAFSINYRLAGQHGTVPSDWVSSKSAYAAIRDAKAAVRWVRAHADTYGLDPDRITAQGGSAGAIAALALGTSDDADYRDELRLEDDWTLATTNPGRSARVATVVDHWGSLSAVNALSWYDGQPRIDASDAPTIIIHGTEDAIVPYAAGLAVRDAFLDAGIPVELQPIAGAGHSPWQATIGGRSQHAIAVDFIVKHQGLDLR